MGNLRRTLAADPTAVNASQLEAMQTIVDVAGWLQRETVPKARDPSAIDAVWLKLDRLLGEVIASIGDPEGSEALDMAAARIRGELQGLGVLDAD